MSSAPSILARLRGIAALADAGHHDLAARKLRDMPMYVQVPYIAILLLLVAVDWLAGKHRTGRHQQGS